MVPGRRDCPNSMVKAYSGYVMSAASGTFRMNFICVDEASVSGGSSGANGGAQLYAVEPAVSTRLSAIQSVKRCRAVCISTSMQGSPMFMAEAPALLAAAVHWPCCW